MKFFTRAWHSGEMTDVRAEQVREEYQQHLAVLNLPASIASLARNNVHDAHVLNVRQNPDHTTISLCLRCGDLQRGYSDITIVFKAATVDGDSFNTLQTASQSASVEVLYDEIDRAGGGFEYRLLLYPDGEANLKFKDVEIVERPVGHR